jgi:hypothetical protein
VPLYGDAGRSEFILPPYANLSTVIRQYHLPGFLFLVAAASAPGFCQVLVKIKKNQAEYFVGEPIFVIVDVKNVGTEPVAYSGCDGHADLIVFGGQKKQTPNLRGCNVGFAEVEGCGVDHPPLMKPGQTISFWYLLKGYSLRPGEYVLRASGKAGVRWKYYSYRSSTTPPPAPMHSETDPVEGRMFEAPLNLTIKNGTEAQLRQRYTPYVADAEGWDMERRVRGRKAIAEMAPAFLKKIILGFANDPETARVAVEGLGQIPTPESRVDLVQLFDKSADLRLRALIVDKLARIGTREEFAFFSSLLPGRSTGLDDQIHIFAAQGLGRLGGEEAVKALENSLQSPNPEVRAAVAVAVGNTRSPAAIPVLTQMYADPAGQVPGQGLCGIHNADSLPMVRRRRDFGVNTAWRLTLGACRRMDVGVEGRNTDDLREFGICDRHSS